MSLTSVWVQTQFHISLIHLQNILACFTSPISQESTEMALRESLCSPVPVLTGLVFTFSSCFPSHLWSSWKVHHKSLIFLIDCDWPRLVSCCLYSDFLLSMCCIDVCMWFLLAVCVCRVYNLLKNYEALNSYLHNSVIHPLFNSCFGLSSNNSETNVL